MAPRKVKAAAEAAIFSGNGMGEGVTLDRDRFKALFDDLLRRMEPIRPHTKVRDITARITLGDAKITKALQGGLETTDPRIVEALATLETLRAEVKALQREWLIPHFVMHAIWSIMDQAEGQGWPLSADGTIAVNLPGILRVTGQVKTEPPF